MAFFRGTGGAGTATFEQLPLAISEGGTSATTVASARVALLPSYSGNATFVLAVNANEDDIEFVTAAAASAVNYSDATANFTGVLQEAGDNVLVSANIGTTVQGYDADTAKLDAATANFTGILQEGGSNVLTSADIGVSVASAGVTGGGVSYSDATANFTGVLQEAGDNVLVSANIGVLVQGYDADTAKLDAATANFTGVLQKAGDNVLVSANIGVTVQGYDADIAFLDAATANFTGVLQDGGSTVLTESSTIEGGTYA
jgi:hypothetical protein